MIPTYHLYWSCRERPILVLIGAKWEKNVKQVLP